MRHAVPLAALLLLATALPAAHAGPAPDLATLKAAALPKALAYLTGLANDPNHDLNVPYLIEAVEGAGLDPGLWPTADASLLDRLVVPALGTVGNDPIREIEAYAQTGYDPRSFAGRDLVADLKAAWPMSLQGVGQASFTILGLHAAGLPDGDPVIGDAVQSLQGGQAAGGAWLCSMPDRVSLVEDVDCTGFALTALASVHALLPSTAALAKAWLDQARNPDGSYEEHPNPADPGAGNVDSTIWAINGYRAVEAPEPEASWRFLLSLQRGDGGFAWKASDPGDSEFATEEIVASLATAFHAWPTYRDAVVAVPALHADVPAQVAVSGPFTAAAWRVLDGSDASAPASGTSATLKLTQPGPAQLHVDAQGQGVHHRERVRLAVANDPPAFADLPAQVSANRVVPFRLQPAVTDPEGQPVALAWALDGQPGQGPIEAAFPALGTHTLRLTATDPHGAAASAEVAVAVVNLPPQVAALSLPATTLPGAPFAYSVQASDPDGLAPTVRWYFGSVEATGPQGQVALPLGHHEVRVDVTDGDGAVVSLTRSIEVAVPTPPAVQVASAETRAAVVASPKPVEPAPVSTQPAVTATHAEESAAVEPGAPNAELDAQPPVDATPVSPRPVPRQGRAMLAVPAVGVASECLLAVALVALVRRRS
jgi:hypothetical protein